ncbi:MAG: LytTR family DNA-binding domain-containing protein [Lachnospiraceae bacterium]|nr:LytTR family DNA-binding domain-containing protein [Lachnospiraceae bacterium]MDE7332897.1 LytTR family DNA-binding domain-containing protein [Lachnospiraceae bacterium]
MVDIRGISHFVPAVISKTYISERGIYMLRIAVCDDIPRYMEELADIIGSWSDVRGIHVQLKKFVSGEDLLFDLECAGDFAAVFMDIELSGIDGTETAVRLRRQSSVVSVVFVSQYENERYLKQMCRIYPFLYMEKPVSRKKAYEVLDQIMEDHKVKYESYFFKYKHRTFNITLGEVLYFASEKRKVRVYLESGREYVFYAKLDVLEDVFSDYSNRFIRIHQSFLVNERHVEEFHPRYVVMRNGEMLPVSRERRMVIGQSCMDMLGRN